MPSDTQIIMDGIYSIVYAIVSATAITFIVIALITGQAPWKRRT